MTLGLEVVEPDTNTDDSLDDGLGMASPTSNLTSFNPDPAVVTGADVGKPPGDESSALVGCGCPGRRVDGPNGRPVPKGGVCSVDDVGILSP